MNVIYLGGNMTPSADYYNDWTKRFIKKLEKSEWKSKNGYECTVAGSSKDPKFIVHHDLARLKRSDIVVVNIGLTDTNHHFTGSICEVYEAHKQNKPVYTFVEPGKIASVQSYSPWFDQFVTKRFGSMDEVITYLIEEEDMP